MMKKIQISGSGKSKLPVYFYLMILSFSLLLTICGFLYAKTNVYSFIPKTQEVSGTVTQVDENTRKFVIPLDEECGDCLMFYCTHAYIHAYAGDHLLYSVEDGNTFFGSSPGCNYHFIDLHNIQDEIVLTIEAVYPQVRNSDITFYQGDAVHMYNAILKNSTFRLIVNLVDLFFCLTLATIFIAGRKKFHFKSSSLWFCVFSFLASVWALINTPWTILLLSNRGAISFLEYMCLMLLTPAALIFMRDVFEPEGHTSWISAVLITVSSANAVILTVLHITGIKEFKQTVVCTFFIMALALAYSLTALFLCVKREGITRTNVVGVVSIVLLTVFYILDMLVYHIEKFSDIFGWIGVSACLLFMGTNTLFDMLSAVELAQKNELYKEMAVRDVDTGLYNKNAYNQWLQETPLIDGLFIITYDLNELKRCNDEYGHLAGDQYIRDAASIFLEIFGRDGSIYRLGGDEFLTIIKGKTEGWIKERLADLERKTSVYNETSKFVDMRIAYGYARYEKEIDKSYEDTRHRADEKMYQKKAEMKRALKDATPR